MINEKPARTKMTPNPAIYFIILFPDAATTNEERKRNIIPTAARSKRLLPVRTFVSKSFPFSLYNIFHSSPGTAPPFFVFEGEGFVNIISRQIGEW